MKQIELNPQNFSFPSFCFERKYKNYLFLESAILANTQEAENYFFELLRFLGENNEKSITSEKEIIWSLLVPYNIDSRWSDSSGNSGIHRIDKGIRLFTLTQLKEYFFLEFYEKKQCHFIQLVDEFWMELANDICVYALYNGEIIVIGTDVKYDFDAIIDKNFKHFVYRSFNDYIDHWGPVLRYSKQQIDFLKQQFSNP